MYLPIVQVFVMTWIPMRRIAIPVHHLRVFPQRLATTLDPDWALWTRSDGQDLV